MVHKVGQPLYNYGDTVQFLFTVDNVTRLITGRVEIVDRYGTFEQNNQPSYDIMVDDWLGTGSPMFVKHMEESGIIPQKRLNWKQYYYNFNENKIVCEDILSRVEDKIRKIKKKAKSYSEFKQELHDYLMYRFWSKCEWETVLYADAAGKLFLKPWVGRDTCTPVDVTNDGIFPWKFFSKAHFYPRDEAKIDVWDQLEWEFNEITAYYWFNRLKYERANKKIFNI